MDSSKEKRQKINKTYWNKNKVYINKNRRLQRKIKKLEVDINKLINDKNKLQKQLKQQNNLSLYWESECSSISMDAKHNRHLK